MKYLLLALLFLTTFAEAQIQIQADKKVQSKLWEAPMVSSLSFEIIPRYDFAEKCQHIEAIAKDYLLSGKLDKIQIDLFERARTTPMLHAFPNDRYGEFVIKPTSSERYLIKANRSDTQKEFRLPVGSFESAEFRLDAISLAEVELQMSANELSLTNLAMQLSKPETELTSQYHFREGLIIKAYGKDLACDLLSGRAKLTAKIQVRVGPNQENLEKLQSFYQEAILPEINETLKSSTQSVRNKAYLLGFRLGTTLENELNIEERAETENGLIALVETLFHESNLEPKYPLQKAGRDYQIMIDRSVQSSLNLHFEVRTGHE